MHNKKQIAGLTGVPGLPWGPVAPCRKETIVTCFVSNPLTEWLTSIPMIDLKICGSVKLCLLGGSLLAIYAVWWYNEKS